MYEFQLLFSSQKPKAKDFRKHCFNVMFPHTRQQIINKMDEDHQQAITEIQGGHQQAITNFSVHHRLQNIMVKLYMK